MRRREFIGSMAVGVLALPTSMEAQQIYTVGYMAVGPVSLC
jgi:hypothetical protein